MIIRSRAPLRLGLAGGGTDVSPYSDLYGGVVLNATIDMYSYCTIIPTDNGIIEITASDRNEYYKSTSDVKLDFENDKNVVLFKGVYNHVVKNYNDNIPLSFKAFTYSDAPAGSGLGTSSTMVVAILKAFVEWLKLPLGEYDIAKTAWIIEREELKLAGGKQDQYAATFGGFNFMEFKQNGDVIVNPLRIKRWILTELESSLVLYFTGVSRESAKIIEQQIKKTENNDTSSIEAMHKLKDSAYKMKDSILRGDFGSFGQCLIESWEAKKNTNSIISNPNIEKTYNYIMENGGKAAKVSGAGGGGFMMIYCDPTKRLDLIKSLEKLNGRVFVIDFTKAGSEGWVIYD